MSESPWGHRDQTRVTEDDSGLLEGPSAHLRVEDGEDDDADDQGEDKAGAVYMSGCLSAWPDCWWVGTGMVSSNGDSNNKAKV